MLKKLKNDKKGFTLVELIVVLVILAILAALLVPALTGYIDRAKEKSVIADTRSAVMAAQTLADEEYAKGDVGAPVTFTNNATDAETGTTCNAVKALSEVKGTVTSVIMDNTNKGKVATLVYENKGKTCTYDASTGQYTVAD